jgi:hypothetical protein
MPKVSLSSSGPKLLRVALTSGLVYGLTQCGDPPSGSTLDRGSQGAAGAGVGGSNPSSGGTGVAGTLGTGAAIIVPDGGPDDGGPPKGPCVGLECQKTTCSAGPCSVPACANNEPLTTVSGTVYEPGGTTPLYNVVVYVPNGPVPEFTDGASCDRCDASIANPAAATLTDTNGRFVLEDVPVGDNIPLVFQVGKWRRQITIPTVPACVDTPLTDPEVTRLPRNKSEGNIPLIAITTGGADTMECLPRRMGIDDAEFTTNTGDGRIHLFAGSNSCGQNPTQSTKAFTSSLNDGATLTNATTLWGTNNTPGILSNYDIVILSCEGCTNEQVKPMAARQALYDYASTGGRVFASHWHRIWFSHGPDPVPEVGTWSDRGDPPDPALGILNLSFPKGEAFADWLVNVMASTVRGELELVEPRDNLQAVNTTHATEWIRTSHVNCMQECCGNNGCNAQEQVCLTSCEADPTAIQLLTFNTPLNVEPDEQCGRVVFNDLHVSATGGERPGAPFPEACEDRPLSAQEKAVMFMLFDLSSCIQDDDRPPIPPVVQ